MPKKYLSAKGSERLDQEREQLEAKFAELRKREEQVHIEQRNVIGSLLLGAVETGDWTEAQLHDLLRPLIKRKKDFEILGMSADHTSKADSATNQESLLENVDKDEDDPETDEDDLETDDDKISEPVSASAISSASGS